MKKTGMFVIVSTITLMTITANPVQAQEAQSDENLAKEAQNPLASLISLPVQNNTNFGLATPSGSNAPTARVSTLQSRKSCTPITLPKPSA